MPPNATPPSGWVADTGPGRIVALVTPPLVAAVALAHPRDPVEAMELVGRTAWWVGLHVALLAVLPLLAATVWLLVAPLRSRAATVCRVALGPALVLYASFDSLVGLATGVLVREAAALPAGTRTGAVALVEGWWAVPPPVGLIAGAAQLLWVVALGAATVARAGAGAGRVATAALAVATVLFPFLHVQPLGAVSMLALLVAVVVLRPRPVAAGRVVAGT